MLGSPASPAASGASPPAADLKLALRPDLRGALHESRGNPYVVIEDPTYGKFYRLGQAEWRFACQLDGEKTLPEAFHAACQNTEHALASTKVEPLCRWLIQNRMLDQREGAKPPTAAAAPGLNPFFIKIPLLRPDRLLAKMGRWTQWLVSWPCFLVWLSICGWGIHAIYSDFSTFLATARQFLSPHTWCYLWVAWIGLKVVHELGHGIVCKHFGGFVGDSGAALILFSPVAYVDVTSAWRFRDRWQRVFTSFAGIYVEFFVAAVAAILWSHTTSPTVGYVCHATIMAASITTVLFNANPLMRFDGYYMLSDALDIQNLYMDGRRYVISVGSRVFLGQSIPAKLPRGWRGLFVRVYGLAAACWRVLVCVSMVIGAGALFHGAGLAIAGFGVLAWLVVPLLKLGKSLMGNTAEQAAKRRRFALRLTAAAALLGGIAMSPSPLGLRAPAVVAYTDPEQLRAETEGFVDAIHVQTRQQVSAGTLLMTLRNDDLLVEYEQVAIQLRQAQVRAQALHRRGEIGAYQAELEQVHALTDQHDDLKNRVESLDVRSPIDGHVVDGDLDTMLGMFVETGTPLLRVAAEDQKEIQIAIPESLVDSYLHRIGGSPRVIVRGDRSHSRLGELTKVEPRATVRLRHPALGANNGGPLAVESDQEAEAEDSHVRLLAPAFHGTIRLTADQAADLSDGQLVYVSISDHRETVARRVTRGTTEWIRNKIALSGY